MQHFFIFFGYFTFLNLINQITCNNVAASSAISARNASFKIDVYMILEKNFTSSLQDLSSPDSVNLIQQLRNFVNNF